MLSIGRKGKGRRRHGRPQCTDDSEATDCACDDEPEDPTLVNWDVPCPEGGRVDKRSCQCPDGYEFPTKRKFLFSLVIIYRIIIGSCY